MQKRNSFLSFAMSLLLVGLGAVALQAQQRVRISNGPKLDTVNGNTAVITWSTDLPSSSRVWWSKDKNNLTHLAEGPESGQTNHKVEILNLEPNTTYYFTVESGQTRGTKEENEAETPNVYRFTTVAQGQTKRDQTPQVAEAGAAGGNLENGKVKITNGPVIEAASGNSATIAWSTNIPGSTRVNYGTDINNMNQLAEAPWGQGGHTHRVELKNLKPNTTYFFQVETGQAAGSDVESHVYSFKTPAHGGQLGRIDHPQQVR
jgi:phosphodiesterase/alkaline phosphatase D-like protein